MNHDDRNLIEDIVGPVPLHQISAQEVFNKNNLANPDSTRLNSIIQDPCSRARSALEHNPSHRPALKHVKQCPICQQEFNRI